MMTSLIIAAALSLPVAEVELRPDELKSTYPGRVASIAQVDIVPQVSGEIREVAFANGASVRAGDVLYRIDPVKYEAAVKNAESKLAETKASAYYAEVSYERHKKLLEKNAVSLDAVDNALSMRDSTRAAFAAAQADLMAAQDDLSHCTIVAPIAGKLGSTAKTAGNYVTAGSIVLVTIVQHDPVRVVRVRRRSARDDELQQDAGGVGGRHAGVRREFVRGHASDRRRAARVQDRRRSRRDARDRRLHDGRNARGDVRRTRLRAAAVRVVPAPSRTFRLNSLIDRRQL